MSAREATQAQHAALGAASAGLIRRRGGLPSGVNAAALQACHRRGWLEVNHFTGVTFLTEAGREALASGRSDREQAAAPPADNPSNSNRQEPLDVSPSTRLETDAAAE